jgi:branched-chain amino acid transport system ATP-binding protein
MFEIKGVSKYFGGLAAVTDLDLNISQGEIIALIGPNGAGKTTTFNLITGFLRPNKGKIVFDGSDITGQSPYSIAEKGIVRTFQATSVFPNFSVLQNLIVSCHLKSKINLWESALHTPGSRKKREHSLNQALKIAQFVGLDNVKDMLARSLPHGFKRTLGIAMALVTEPKLLLLDEPVTGMNAEEISRTIVLTKKIWQSGVSILLIEHNMKVAMSLCQRIVVLNFGKKIAEGSPEEISKNKEVIQAYLGSSYAAKFEKCNSAL